LQGISLDVLKYLTKSHFLHEVKEFMKLASKLSVLMFALVFAGSAVASTAGGTLTVTANIATSCSINSPTLAFGNYAPIGANASSPLDQQADVTWTCTATTPIVIWLNEGNNKATGSVLSAPQRQMASGGNMLAYFLYSDEGRGTLWGSTDATSPFLLEGTGSPQSATIYGRIPAGQPNVPGAYTDSVTISLNY
jgi:spore coat protein U-like protein